MCVEPCSTSLWPGKNLVTSWPGPLYHYCEESNKKRFISVPWQWTQHTTFQLLLHCWVYPDILQLHTGYPHVQLVKCRRRTTNHPLTYASSQIICATTRRNKGTGMDEIYERLTEQRKCEDEQTGGRSECKRNETSGCCRGRLGLQRQSGQDWRAHVGRDGNNKRMKVNRKKKGKGERSVG